MFAVKLSHIPETKALLEKGLEIPPSDLGLGEPFTGKALTLDYELRWVGEKILGTFKAGVEMSLCCARCLEDFKQKAESEFVIQFEPEPESGQGRGEADPDDPGLNVVFFTGELLELGEEIRQEMELKVPIKPLCREDCQGLCSLCGANKNEGDCGCVPEPPSGPFSGLNKLFNQSKE